MCRLRWGEKLGGWKVVVGVFVVVWAGSGWCMGEGIREARGEGGRIYLTDYIEERGRGVVHWSYNGRWDDHEAVVVEDGQGREIGRVRYPADRFYPQDGAAPGKVWLTPVNRAGQAGRRCEVELKDTSAALEVKGMARIGVRRGARFAGFVERGSGRPVVLKGVNYIRLRGGDHGTFEATVGDRPAYYDPLECESMFRLLRRCGCNTVRVFIIGRSAGNPGIAGEYERTKGLYEPYLRNVVDFLRRARRYGIYVLPTFGDGELPRNRYYREMLKGVPDGKNGIYLTRKGIAAKQSYIVDFLRGLKKIDGDVWKVLLGVQLQNEMYLDGAAWPFTVRTGTLTMANGQTYDMADPAQRQALMDEGINYYYRALVKAVKAVDPELLVSEGVFTWRAVGKDFRRDKGVYAREGGDRRFPPALTVLGQSGLDFLDVHFYRVRREESVGQAWVRDMASTGFAAEAMALVRRETPVILGEFGAFRKVDDSFAEAAEHLIEIRDLASRESMAGWLMWTFDCFEQKRLYPALEGGELFLQRLSEGSAPVTK